jgi:hypothetical protein
LEEFLKKQAKEVDVQIEKFFPRKISKNFLPILA